MPAAAHTADDSALGVASFHALALACVAWPIVVDIASTPSSFVSSTPIFLAFEAAFGARLLQLLVSSVPVLLRATHLELPEHPSLGQACLEDLHSVHVDLLDLECVSAISSAWPWCS